MENARSRIVQTESAVRDINDAIGSIKDLIIRASKGTLSQTERESICAEIAQYRSQIISSLNASDSGGYMLGGYNTHTPPMTQDEGVLCYNGIELSTMTQEEYSELRAQTIEVNLGQGVTMEASITALDLIGYGSDNLIATLTRLPPSFGGAIAIWLHSPRESRRHLIGCWYGFRCRVAKKRLA